MLSLTLEMDMYPKLGHWDQGNILFRLQENKIFVCKGTYWKDALSCPGGGHVWTGAVIFVLAGGQHEAAEKEKTQWVMKKRHKATLAVWRDSFAHSMARAHRQELGRAQALSWRRRLAREVENEQIANWGFLNTFSWIANLTLRR